MSTRFFDWYYKGYRYVHDRFTKEKISSWGGLALFLLAVAGELTQSQIGAIQVIGSMFGLDFSSYADAAIGISAVLLPTSRFKSAATFRAMDKKS